MIRRGLFGLIGGAIVGSQIPTPQVFSIESAAAALGRAAALTVDRMTAQAFVGYKNAALPRLERKFVFRKVSTGRLASGSGDKITWGK